MWKSNHANDLRKRLIKREREREREMTSRAQMQQEEEVIQKTDFFSFLRTNVKRRRPKATKQTPQYSYAQLAPINKLCPLKVKNNVTHATSRICMNYSFEVIVSWQKYWPRNKDDIAGRIPKSTRSVRPSKTKPKSQPRPPFFFTIKDINEKAKMWIKIENLSQFCTPQKHWVLKNTSQLQWATY